MQISRVSLRFYKYMMRLMPWTIANDFMEYRLMQRMLAFGFFTQFVF